MEEYTQVLVGITNADRYDETLQEALDLDLVVELQLLGIDVFDAVQLGPVLQDFEKIAGSNECPSDAIYVEKHATDAPANLKSMRFGHDKPATRAYGLTDAKKPPQTSQPPDRRV